MIDPNNMDWNNPIMRRQVALNMLLSDPDISNEEKASIITSLELVRALEAFRPIEPQSGEKPSWPPTHTGDILGNDEDEDGCKGGCSCNNN
jgi:hypothetical protein